MNQTISTMIKRAAGLLWMMKNDGQFARLPFNYHVDFGNALTGTGIAPGASSTVAVTTQSDSHFLCHALTFNCIDITAHTAIAAPNATVQVNDTGSGANWYDGALQLVNVAGTAQLPMILLPPRLVKPAATLSVTITNNQSTNTQFFELVFIGEKIFDYTGES